MAKYGLNQVTLIGNLGKDPEVKYLDQGIALANLWIACTDRIRDKAGNYIDRTEWVNVNLWRGQAEIAGKYCRKGSTVCIEGRLITRSWETPQGEKRSKTEVEGRKLILLDSPGTPSGSSLPNAAQTQVPASPVTSSIQTKPVENPAVASPQENLSTAETDNDLDDLPF